MNKKQQRKELEVTLVKTIEDLLLSINPEAARDVLEITYGAAKILAKKFYKAVKHTEEKKETPVKKKPVKKVGKARAAKTAKPTIKKSKSKK